MSFIQDLAVKIIGTPYVIGALVRQGISVAAVALVSIGVLDPQLTDQWVNANVPVIVGLILWLIQLSLSVKEKVAFSKEVKVLQGELLQLKGSA